MLKYGLHFGLGCSLGFDSRAEDVRKGRACCSTPLLIWSPREGEMAGGRGHKKLLSRVEYQQCVSPPSLPYCVTSGDSRLRESFTVHWTTHSRSLYDPS